MTTAITPETQVGVLVTEKPSRAVVFEKHRIDYCCGGQVALSEICEKKGIPVDQLLNELKAHDATATDAEPDWASAKLSDLIDNIVHKHHDWLRQELPRLLQKAERVAAVHGHNHPETIEVLNVYREMKDELEEHMGKEEGVLFPWIRGLENGTGKAPFPGMKMDQPINCMVHDHDKTGNAFERLEELTNNYTPPADACNTFRVLYEGLRDIQEDTHRHVHKENSILFPRALDLAS